MDQTHAQTHTRTMTDEKNGNTIEIVSTTNFETCETTLQFNVTTPVPKPCIHFNRAYGCMHTGKEDGDVCKFSHVCRVCRSSDHSATECKVFRPNEICFDYNGDVGCVNKECPRLHICSHCGSDDHFDSPAIECTRPKFKLYKCKECKIPNIPGQYAYNLHFEMKEHTPLPLPPLTTTTTTTNEEKDVSVIHSETKDNEDIPNIWNEPTLLEKIAILAASQKKNKKKMFVKPNSRNIKNKNIKKQKGKTIASKSTPTQKKTQKKIKKTFKKVHKTFHHNFKQLDSNTIEYTDNNFVKKEEKNVSVPEEKEEEEEPQEKVEKPYRVTPCIHYNRKYGCKLTSDDSCTFAHICRVCKSPDHGSSDCREFRWNKICRDYNNAKKGCENEMCLFLNICSFCGDKNHSQPECFAFKQNSLNMKYTPMHCYECDISKIPGDQALAMHNQHVHFSYV